MPLFFWGVWLFLLLIMCGEMANMHAGMGSLMSHVDQLFPDRIDAKLRSSAIRAHKQKCAQH